MDASLLFRFVLGFCPFDEGDGNGKTRWMVPIGFLNNDDVIVVEVTTAVTGFAIQGKPGGKVSYLGRVRTVPLVDLRLHHIPAGSSGLASQEIHRLGRTISRILSEMPPAARTIVQQVYTRRTANLREAAR